MTTVPAIHQLRTTVSPASPLEIEAGQPLTLTVEVSCSAGCALARSIVNVSSGDRVLGTANLASGEEGGDLTTLHLDAPNEVGDHSWTLAVFAAEGDLDAAHHQSTVDILVRSLAHKTSLAVWDVKSPVPAGADMVIRVGVKCSAACQLAERRVVLVNADGNVVAEGLLGDTPVAKTAALYSAAVTAVAPPVLGLAQWSAKFDAGDLPVAHETSMAVFTFTVDQPAAHRVTLELVGKDSQLPLSDAEVRLGLYVTFTDAAGRAAFDLPTGSYDLGLRKDGYEAPPVTVDVGGDATVRVEAVSAMTQAEKEKRLAQFLDIDWG